MIKRYQPHMYPGFDDVCSSEDVAVIEEELASMINWIFLGADLVDKFPNNWLSDAQTMRLKSTIGKTKRVEIATDGSTL